MCSFAGDGSLVIRVNVLRIMIAGDKNVSCCGSDFDWNLGDVRYSFQRSWVKAKKLKDKVLDKDR